MKKLITLTLFICAAFFAKAQSQDFGSFKFDIGFGGAIPSSGSGTKAGATFTLQPHYRLSDELSLGLRLEAAAIGYENTVTDDTKVSALASACFTGEYYFSNNGFRPFVGAGIGLFDQESASANDNSDGNLSARTTGFGAFPEAGFEAGHFRFSIEYNIVGNSNSYLAGKIGFFIGGGKK